MPQRLFACSVEEPDLIAAATAFRDTARLGLGTACAAHAIVAHMNAHAKINLVSLVILIGTVFLSDFCYLEYTTGTMLRQRWFT